MSLFRFLSALFDKKEVGGSSAGSPIHESSPCDDPDGSGPYDFLAIDFETACSSSNSACAVGIACIKDLQVVRTVYSLLRPPALRFDPINIRIHGITPDMVKKAPTLDAFWPKISPLFSDGCIVLAHNAPFDMSVLRNSASVEIPNFLWADTIPMAAPLVPGSHSLDHCAEVLGIDMGTHHNAEDDAVTCAEIAIAAINAAGADSIEDYLTRNQRIRLKSFATSRPQNPCTQRPRSPRKYESIRISDICPDAQAHMDPANPLYGKTIVFTGTLSIDRRTAMQLAVNAGAILKSSVTRKTDYLVVGVEDPSLVGADGRSKKQRDADELNASGEGYVTTLTETAFLELAQAPVGADTGALE